VSEIQFGETAGGAAIVQGSHVAAGASKCPNPLFAIYADHAL